MTSGTSRETKNEWDESYKTQTLSLFFQSSKRRHSTRNGIAAVSEISGDEIANEEMSGDEISAALKNPLPCFEVGK